jgi:hypothetical protein
MGRLAAGTVFEEIVVDDEAVHPNGVTVLHPARRES